MASNLDYLDPNLLPLEEKVTAYLAAEEELRQLNVATRTYQAETAQPAPDTAPFEQRPPTGSFDQTTDEQTQQRDNLHTTLDALRQEVLALLPTRDEWVKVNLGYGPSRVGAFRDENSPADAPNYILRVVH
ncbi:hypothetical protein [Hymenobacter jeollabukensis]|uniref:Uncharacterized protein n=1 Tax=Hymenobacter jeollabukensis TaxID=2025313 RepID=A0A5R8WWA3_9BACT|nr:hypothetical protein [Hymenobacter jeollabukensis]TLM96811.1 hypothetical protein FDY95_02120 [Hymenobacter jeollabukensis]